MSYIFTCLKKRHISASPYFLINSNLIEYIPYLSIGRMDITNDILVLTLDVTKRSKLTISSATTNTTYGRIAVYGDTILLDRQASFANKEFDISDYEQLNIYIGSASSSVTSVIATLSNIEIR